ncbi:MAG TPA: type II secretion system protein N [Steroidobacteraceae bacterium]|nr:type II secretion system protein N [Steroidobacteraceae bacterium]
MRRGTLIATVLAGIVVFLAVLVLYLPAGWFASFLPAQVKCRELGGSVWSGECLGLRFQDVELGDATWNLAVGGVLAGRLRGDVDVRGATLALRADLDTDFDGVGELRKVTARIPLEPAVLPQLPPNQRGTVTADLPRVVLGAGPAPRLIQGFIEVRDLRQLGPQPLDLGSYRVDFDGVANDLGEVHGKLRDLGGPFLLEGTVNLQPPSSYIVQGMIAGRTSQAENIVREITLGAQPDTSGRSQFSFEGTY